MSSKRNRKIKTYNLKTRSRNRRLTAVAVIAIIAIAIIAYVMIAQSGSHKASPNIAVNTPSPSPSPTSSSSSPFPAVTPLTSPAGEYSADGTKVLFVTSMGDVVIQMREDKPVTTTNFVDLVKEGFYNGTIFQRVIAGFMIQGGENNSLNVPTIPDEIGNDNHNYNMTIAMAKTSEPNSATSQFFINVADNNSTSFDSTYTVFGQVIYGQDTVMKISQVPVQANPAYGGEVSQPIKQVTLIGAVVMP